MFGVDLETLISIENASREKRCTVPSFVEKCCRYMLEAGLRQDDFMRASGTYGTPDSQIVETVIQEVDRGRDLDLSLCCTPKIAWELLRSFLRKLPEPLVAERTQKSLMALRKKILVRNNELFRKYRETVSNELDPIAFHLLKFLSKFFAILTRKADKKRKMEVNFVAQNWASIIFRSRIGTEIIVRQQQLVEQILTDLVEGYDSIWKTDDEYSPWVWTDWNVSGAELFSALLAPLAFEGTSPIPNQSETFIASDVNPDEALREAINRVVSDTLFGKYNISLEEISPPSMAATKGVKNATSVKPQGEREGIPTPVLAWVEHREERGAVEHHHAPQVVPVSLIDEHMQSLRLDLDLSSSDDEGGAGPELSGVVGEIVGRLNERRRKAGRPDDMNLMTNQQLADDKRDLQQALLQFESKHGRPRDLTQKHAMRPLYARYRELKKRVAGGGRGAAAKDVTASWVGQTPTRAYDTAQDDRDDSTELQRRLQGMDSEQLYNEARRILEEKSQLKRKLKRFEMDFMHAHGRQPLKAERGTMQDDYAKYKDLKSQAVLIETMINKKPT